MDKRTKLLNLLKEQLLTDGALVAMWGEADGNAGYLIRPDGGVLGLGDYQESIASIGKMSVSMLGNCVTHCQPYLEFEKESGDTLSLKQIHWLNGINVPTAEVSFVGDMKYPLRATVTKEIEYRDLDKGIKKLKVGDQMQAYNCEHLFATAITVGSPVPKFPKDAKVWLEHPSKGYAVLLPLEYIDLA